MEPQGGQQILCYLPELFVFWVEGFLLMRIQVLTMWSRSIKQLQLYNTCIFLSFRFVRVFLGFLIGDLSLELAIYVCICGGHTQGTPNDEQNEGSRIVYPAQHTYCASVAMPGTAAQPVQGNRVKGVFLSGDVGSSSFLAATEDGQVTAHARLSPFTSIGVLSTVPLSTLARL